MGSRTLKTDSSQDQHVLVALQRMRDPGQHAWALHKNINMHRWMQKTSVHRSLNTLKRKGLVYESDVKVAGPYGPGNTLWVLQERWEEFCDWREEIDGERPNKVQ